MGNDSALKHRERRKAILAEFPEIEKLYGVEPWTGVYAVGILVLQLSLAYVVSRAGWGAAFLFGITVGPYVDLGILSCMHELSHNLGFESAAANRLVSIATNLPMIFPISEIFRQHHRMHHTHLGGDDRRDVDVPCQVEKDFVRNNTLLKATWLALNMIIMPLRSLFTLPVVPNKYVVLNWIGCITFGVSAFLYSRPAFAYLFMSLLFSQGLHPANARQVQEHVQLPQLLARRKAARKEREAALIGAGHSLPAKVEGKWSYEDLMELDTFSYYGALNAFTLNVGFHVEHHDFSRIPWSKLPELRVIAGSRWYPEDCSHASRGIADIFDFVFNKSMSLQDFGSAAAME